MEPTVRRKKRAASAQPRLTLIIPSFNEVTRIESGLIRLRTAAAMGAVDLDETEVLWVDDGSTDGTAAAAELAAASLPNASVLQLKTNRGKGGAVRAGVERAKGKLIIFCDADFSIDAKHIADLVAALETSDVAIGSRAVSGSVEYGHGLRTLGGRAFNRLVNAITHLDLRDTQCGMKGFRADVARLLFATTAIDRFAFDVELLTRCRQFGFSVKEVPVAWDEIEGSSIRPFADPMSMLLDLTKSQFGGRIRPVAGYLVRTPTTSSQLAARIANVTATPRPIVVEGKGQLLVLFPFARGAELSSLNAHVRAALSPLELKTDAFTVTTLSDLAPLHLSQE